MDPTSGNLLKWAKVLRPGIPTFTLPLQPSYPPPSPSLHPSEPPTRYRINAEQRFYKQEYCGCAFSLRDTNEYRRKEGIDPVVVAGGKVYADPELDSQEESPEVVREFFEHTTSPQQEQARELREMYRRRRKNARSARGNNW